MGRSVRRGIGGQDLELQQGAGRAANCLHQIRQGHATRVHKRVVALSDGEDAIPRLELSAEFGWRPGQQPVDNRITILHPQFGANAYRRHVLDGFDGRVPLRGVGQLLGILQGRVGVLHRPAAQDRVNELGTVARSKMLAQGERAGRISAQQGEGGALQHHRSVLAVGQLVGPLHRQLRVLGKLDAQASFEAEIGNRPSALPGRVQLTVFPFRNQSKQGGFTLGLVGELLGGAQGGLRFAGGQCAKGLTDLRQPLGFVHGCEWYLGRCLDECACARGRRLRT